MSQARTVTDIDIDVANRDKVLKLFDYTVASIDRDNKLVQHNTGVYFHDVPSNPFTNRCTFDHKEAEELGFFKLDLLNLSLYNDIETEEHLCRLLDIEPEWDLLEHEEICEQLHHVNGYAHILRALKPRSVIELAMVLALIRPGKKHLYARCARYGFEEIKNLIWTKTEDGVYSFKKSHAIAYATAIVVQLNRFVEKAGKGS